MIAILVIIICLQIFIFVNILRKINTLKSVFNTFYALDETQNITYNTKTSNTIFRTIVECINSYLRNNGSRANDYHLMQDIAERNCDSAEEEIQSQVPTTLYLGLVGTMFGIILGLGDLDLNQLFGTETTTSIKDMATDVASNMTSKEQLHTETVTQLLSDVSKAMIASVFGIIFTTILTFLFKDAKAKNASGKNLFLSWIQANLLPNMSSDVNVALEKMSNALSQFNEQFAENTQKLNDTLSLVSETSRSQAELYNVIHQLDISEMAKANVKVYKALQNSADEITYLAQMLHSSQEYVNEVRLLNESLDKSEQRTKMFEEMGNFFKSELSAVEERKKMFLNTIDEIDKEHVGQFNKLAGNFESKTENAVKEITEKFENQNNEMMRFVGRQEDIVKGSDLAKIPQKMSALDSKMQQLEKTVLKNHADLRDDITLIDDKISHINVTAQNSSETQTNLWLLSVCVAVVIASQIISANMDYSVTKSILVHMAFWSGIIGIIVSLVKGKK